MIRHILPGFLSMADKGGAQVGAAWRSRNGKPLFRGIICAAWELKLDYGKIPRLHLEIHEGWPTEPAQFDGAVAFFEAVGYPLLVHCNAGRNRSAAACAAILVGAFKAPFWRAVERTNPDLPSVLYKSLEDWAATWDARKDLVRNHLRPKFEDMLKGYGNEPKSH